MANLNMHEERLRKVILSSMVGRTKAKYELGGLDWASVSSSPLMMAELESAADCITEAVWGEVAPLIRGIHRDSFIIDYLLEALGAAGDDIYDMAIDAYENGE